MGGSARVGISGWNYPPWRGVFYPPGLPQRLELEHAASLLSTIEVNGSFYALQKPESFRAWHDRTPPDFLFSVKGGRFVTHMKKLRGVEVPLANFFASGVLALGAKLGPLLWQLPPNLGYDEARLADFFALLPRTTTAAAALAAGHDERVEGRAWLTTDADRPLRHALEVRHPTYENTRFLRPPPGARHRGRHRGHRGEVAAVPGADRPSYAYVRLHGDAELYVSGYSDEALDTWAARVKQWRDEGRDVVVYFDNDVKVHAPYDAQRLAARLG